MLHSEWQQLRELFEETILLPENLRQDFIERATEPGSVLRRQLESLVAADGIDQTLQTPIQEASNQLQNELEPCFLGQQMGPYKVTELIGKGGMGFVYRCLQKSGDFEQDVAIKFLRHHDPELVRRMTVEQQNLSALNHPHIAKIFDAGTTAEGSPYLVMEYIEGRGLAQYLQEQEPSQEQMLDLFHAICQAVDYSHRNLIIHRDLKPSNIMVDDQGLPKLIDYGIAKQLSLTEEGEHTITVQQAWSPNYASPEQVRGERLSTATDIYALGLILYRLVLGEDAQQAQNLSLDQAVNLICEQSPQISKGAIPPDLARVILKAVHKDPVQRYASAKELAEDLLRFRRKQPVLAVGDSTLYRVRKWLERNQLSAAVGAIAVILLALSFNRIIAERNAALISEARALTAEAESRTQLQRADEVSAFLTDIFTAADVRVNAGQEPTARSLLEEGHKDIRARENLDPELKIDLLLTMAKAYANSGQEDEALSASEQAMEIWQSLGHGTSMQRADILNGLGNAYMRIDFSEQGLPLLEEALEIHQRELPANHSKLAHTLNNLGSTLVSLDQLEEGRGYLYQALDIMKANPDIPLLSQAAVYHNLARAERRSANPQQALEHINRSLRIKDQIYTTAKDPHMAGWHVRSQIARELGDWDQVLSDLQQILTMSREQFPTDNLQELQVLMELANYYHDIGEFETAENYYLQSLEHKLNEQRPVSKATNLNNLGFLYEDMQQYQRALPLFEQSMAIRLEEFGADSSRYATALNNLGRLLIQLGRFDESQAYLEQSLAIRQPLLDPNHPRIIGLELHLLELAMARGSCEHCPEGFQAISQRMEESNSSSTSNWVRLHQFQAQYWESQGQPEQALTHWQQAYQHRVDNVGPEHPFSIRIQQAIERLGGEIQP